MTQRPKFILFDWGGTLVEVERQPTTYAPCASAACAALSRLGIPNAAALSDNLATHFATRMTQNDAVDNPSELDSVVFLRDWAREQNFALPDDLDGVVEALWAPWVGCLDPMGDIRGTLATLRQRNMTLGLVSNCAALPDACRAELARQGLADLFAFTLFSSEVGVRKPHPKIYDVALTRAQSCNGHGALAPSDFLFVGDTPPADITGPASLGMRTVLLRTGRWGGDESELTTQPDHILNSVHDLPKLWS